MSCTSNWPTPEPRPSGRRQLLRLGLAAALAGIFGPAGGSTVKDSAAFPPAGLRPWGSGEFRRFGLRIYDARLWVAAAPPEAAAPALPFALELTYRRALRGERLAQASVDEMRRLGLADESRLAGWGEQLRGLFPDVAPGDRIAGLAEPGGARFFLNGQALGRLTDPALSAAFFAIWLDRRTSAPELREALLRRPAED